MRGDGNWTDSEGWPSTIFSDSEKITIHCSRPTDNSISKVQWSEALGELIKNLEGLRDLGVEGSIAVSAALESAPEVVISNKGIKSISYVQPSAADQVYSWPKAGEAQHSSTAIPNRFRELPFSSHQWKPIDMYYGPWGAVGNVQFNLDYAAKISQEGELSKWFVLLDAYVSEQGNDSILQKMVLAECLKDGSYKVFEPDGYFENAGGGEHDLIMSQPIVSARGDIITHLPNHYELGRAVIVLDQSSNSFQQVDTFKVDCAELIAVGDDLKVEVMKYLSHFPEHIKRVPWDGFEKIIAEILASHGFSDIQLNVRNEFGEIDILAFEKYHQGRKTGYIIECKRYKDGRKVALREAHVLAMKTRLMRGFGVEKGMLVTTSEFTAPTKRLYDSAWGLELQAIDEVIDWLTEYKPKHGGLYL